MKTIIDMQRIIQENSVVLTKKQKGYLKIKRVLDIIVSFTALIVFLPIMLIVALLIKIESPTEPVIFVQLRVGKDYKVFKLFKFRSMKSTAPRNVASGEFEDVEKYITLLGRIIRSTSIDEFPQFINILRGDMSVIGPRPLVYTEREIRFIRRYYGIYQVRPGLSGMAQINGRDYLSTYVKVAYDREYVKKIGFITDIKLFFKTIYVVLCRIGIVEGKHNKAENEDQLLDELIRQDHKAADMVQI